MFFFVDQRRCWARSRCVPTPTWRACGAPSTSCWNSRRAVPLERPPTTLPKSPTGVSSIVSTFSPFTPFAPFHPFLRVFQTPGAEAGLIRIRLNIRQVARPSASSASTRARSTCTTSPTSRPTTCTSSTRTRRRPRTLNAGATVRTKSEFLFFSLENKRKKEEEHVRLTFQHQRRFGDVARVQRRRRDDRRGRPSADVQRRRRRRRRRFVAAGHRSSRPARPFEKVRHIDLGLGVHRHELATEPDFLKNEKKIQIDKTTEFDFCSSASGDALLMCLSRKRFDRSR